MKTKFNSQNIKSVLDNQKTKTRRPIKSKATSMVKNGASFLEYTNPNDKGFYGYEWSIRDKNGTWNEYKNNEEFIKNISKHQIGDISQLVEVLEDGTEKKLDKYIKYTGIDIEALQDINDEDCEAEGIIAVDFRPDDGYPICEGYMGYPDDKATSLFNNKQDAFKRDIWDKLPYKKPYDWDNNPYVFVYEFEKVDKI